MARYDIYDGIISNGLTLSSGTSMYISSGGTANNTTIDYYGSMHISSGGTANNTTIDYYGSMHISSGGTANSTTVNSGGGMYISSGGTATNVIWTPCVGLVSAADGAYVTYASTYSGVYFGSNNQLLSHTQSMSGKVVSGTMYVMDGGVANSTTVNSRGSMHISSGGTANSTTVNSGGYMRISSGGTANSTTVNSGGHMYISSGGTANSTTVNSSALMIISSGGTANSTTVNNFGAMRISSGGTANNTTVNDWGWMHISSGGVANSTTVNFLSVMFILSGGTANSTTVNSRGSMSISSDGVARNTTVNSGGYICISSGGSATDLTLSAGGQIGGFSFAEDKYFANISNGLAIVADNVYIIAEGMHISSGGTANSTTVNFRGNMNISSGGVANSTIVNSYGSMRISSGGVHRGSLQIESEATVVAYSGAIIDFTVADRKTEDGYLINDLSRISWAPTYTITVDDQLVSGTYKLAQGASNFTGTITIGDGSVNYGSITVNGNDFVYNGVTYSLDQVNGNLTLTIKAPDITPPELTITGNATASTNQDVVLKISANENCTILYNIDNGEWHTYSGGITVTANGTVNIKATDEAGNITEKSVVVDMIDKIAPTLEISGNATEPINQDVILTATASDGIVEYWNGAEWITGNTITATTNGTYQFRVTDKAGNVTEKSVVVDQIDKVAPTKPEVFASTTAPTNKNVTVSAEFSLDSIKQQFSYDNQTWYDYESGIVLSRNGVLYFRGIDAVGNISEVARYAVTNIDKIAPSAPIASADITSLTNKPVTVSATFSDDAAKQQYSFDGLVWDSYTSAIVMANNGTVYFRAVDDAGNISDTTEYAVENIDRIAPAKPMAYADITGETTGAVTVSAIFSNDSVITEFSLDNKTWQTYTDGVVMESNGTVYFRGIDAAGNVSQVAVYEVNNIIAAPDTIDDDLDGNGLADVILRHTKQGFTGAWLTTGDESVIKWGSLSDIKDNVRLLGTGKLYGTDNDGQDIFFADGKSVGAWKVVDGKVTGYQYVMGVNSTTNVLGLGDFNGDGTADILLRSTSGDLGYFGTDGTGWHYLKGLGKEWSVAAVGDLNGDGLDDVVLRHDAGFAGTFLIQSNNTVKWANLDTLANDMSIVGTGDFNGDGVDDVLLQKADGWVGAWLVEDGSVDGFMGICKNTNSIEQIADFNGDGIDDLRIRTATGDIGVLYVNGADDTTWQYFQSVGSEWETKFSALA